MKWLLIISLIINFYFFFKTPENEVITTHKNTETEKIIKKTKIKTVEKIVDKVVQNQAAIEKVEQKSLPEEKKECFDNMMNTEQREAANNFWNQRREEIFLRSFNSNIGTHEKYVELMDEYEKQVQKIYDKYKCYWKFCPEEYSDISKLQSKYKEKITKLIGNENYNELHKMIEEENERRSNLYDGYSPAAF